MHMKCTVILCPYSWIVIISFLSFLDLISVFRTDSRTSSAYFAFAFNIDEEFPIVISNRFDGKDAHFGASVILLPLATQNGQHDGDGSGLTGWVLISAPKANSTTTMNQSRIFEPGLVWRCSLGGYQNRGGKKLCEILDIDPTAEYDPFDRNQPFRDRKDGGWLGGAMFVGDSDRFVSCASRWVNQKYLGTYLVNGICYWLPKTEVVAEMSGQSWPRLPPKLSYRLMPLLNRTKQYREITSAKLIAQLDRNSVFDWAYGQFGFSIHVTPNNELISGAPGTYDWTGSIVYYRDTLGPQPSLRRYNAHAGSPAFSELLVVPSETLSYLFNPSEYFGYSVTSGKFFKSSISKNKTQFAAGAPRSSELSGKVIIFSLKEVKGSRSEGRLELLVDALEGREATMGNSYASYFGSQLLALDVNGDGFDDLLVSAPLFGAPIRYKRNAVVPESLELDEGDHTGSSEDSEDMTQAKVKNGDEGCVFVYLSTGEEFSPSPQQLWGSKVPSARFGMALNSLRDVNFDGFNDVAIGAPYENEGRGAVYLYYGGKKEMKLAQKLKPELIDPKIRTFGWSISLGEDIDHNGYPDLAVGAYETNQVVIYRAIPIVHFSVTLTASIPKVLSTTEEFNLTSCISYEGHGSIPSGLAIWLKLTVDVEPQEGKRLVALIDEIAEGGQRLFNSSFIQNRSSNTSQRILLLSYQRRLHVRGDGFGSCYNFSAIRVGSIDGVSRTITIRQETWLRGYPRNSGPPKPIHYEIHPGQIFQTTKFPSPAVNISQSKSQFGDFRSTKLLLSEGKLNISSQLLLPVGTICEADGDPECLANLTISAWLLDQQTREVYDSSRPFVLGATEILTLHVELANSRETASLPVTVTLNWTPPPDIRRLPANCEYSGGNSLVCSIRRAIKENQKESMEIDLEMSGVYGAPPEVKNNLGISFDANTSSSLVVPAEFKLTVPLKTSMTPQNFSHQSSKIEYSVGNESIATFGFTQGFELGIVGPSSAAGVVVTFDIPVGLYLSSNGNDQEYHRFIAVKKPLVTYDGIMKCKTVNESFEEDLLQDPDISGITPRTEEEIDGDILGNDDLDYDIQKVDETSKILKGKMRRIRRSVLTSLSLSDEQSDNHDEGGILKINCDRSSSSMSNIETTCMRVICTASHFTPSKKAVIEFKLRMFNKVATKLLSIVGEDDHYDNGIGSLWIESFGVLRTIDADGTAFGESGIVRFTSRLKIPPPYDLPAWILIVSVGGGILLFTVVTVLLKRCGFFRRAKRDELVRRKVEHLEKYQLLSNTANIPSTPSTARIRTKSSSPQHKENGHPKTINRKGSNTRPLSLTPIYTGGTRTGSILGLQVTSPASPVTQREMPGAVDLNELRRLYAHDDDPFY